MTNDPRYNHLRELSWRRKLTEAEEAELRVWLATHPDAQADWDAEAGLTEALGRLPDAPLPSNFTARVLQAIEQAAGAERPAGGGKWRHWLSRPRWLPKAALAAIVLCAAFISYNRYQLRAAALGAAARSVVAVSKVSALPSPQILEDFDAIRALNQTPPADVQLLSLLQ